MTRLFLVLLLVACAFAQPKKDDGDDVVSVPKKYVSSEGLSHQSDVASKWVGVGREIGQATREGLGAVVDTADKFGQTKVGTFVMVMIAWKVLAMDVLRIALGVPIMIGGVCLWMWAMRRFFFGYRVLDRREGKTKVYVERPPYKFGSNDCRGMTGGFAFAAIIAWTVGMTAVILVR